MLEGATTIGTTMQEENFSVQSPPSQTDAPASTSLPVAYLLSRYPAVSHTFFLQEVTGLRRLGVEIHTASINTPDRADSLLTEEEAQERDATYYVKAEAPLRLLFKTISLVLKHPGVTWRGLRTTMQLNPWHIKHSAYALFYLAEALLVGDWMRRKQLTHLHVHFTGAVASVGMIASQAWGFPYSLTVHGPDDFFNQQQISLRQKVESAEFVICISDYCRSQLMRLIQPGSWNKLHVVRLGVVPELSAGQPRRAAAQPLRVLCTGRLVGAKGQAILLLATEKLVQRGHQLNITLIGDGADRSRLEQLVIEKQLTSSVIFAGAKTHDEVLESLESSDLFVLPSFAEGIPVALMEAMAIGVPCISTFVAGIPELIRHECDGLLVPAGSVDALADAMERMILSPEDRERLRRSAREQVMTHYNLAHNLPLLASTMRRLTAHATA